MRIIALDVHRSFAHLFVFPTLSFRLLCGLVIPWHGRRQSLSLGVTAHPTAEWIARQLTSCRLSLWDGIVTGQKKGDFRVNLTPRRAS